jgi:hypothetical protein
MNVEHTSEAVHGSFLLTLLFVYKIQNISTLVNAVVLESTDQGLPSMNANSLALPIDLPDNVQRRLR